jgi:hypothetical protein
MAALFSAKKVVRILERAHGKHRSPSMRVTDLVSTSVVMAFALTLLTAHSPGLARADDSAASSSRRKALVKGLRSESNAYRSLEELATSTEMDKPTWRSILEVLEDKDAKLQGASPDRLVDALAAGGAKMVPATLDALARIDASDKYDHRFPFLVASLGRMGEKAKAAITPLQEMLKKRKMSAQSKAALRVVLASIGDNSKENQAAILKDLKSDQVGYRTVTTMVMVRSLEWVPDETVKGFTDSLSDFWSDTQVPYRGIEWGAALLGLLGKRAKAATKDLELLQRKAIKDRAPEAIVLSLALARIDPKVRAVALRRLLENWSELQEGFILGTYIYIYEFSYLLMDRELGDYLADKLEDKDASVRDGAAMLLEGAGLRASASTGRVLQIVRGNGGEDQRVKAAKVLGRIAEFGQIAELEKACREEKVEAVRNALETAIDHLRN